MNAFCDHFSGLADEYARYRPGYPDGLFAYLAGLAPTPDAVWDCATGSGQAAVGLSRHFRSVFATDASERQLAVAQPRTGVRYRVAPAEQSGLADESVDMVTVAQALHWFDLGGFYAEVRRVLKPGGILAVWTYNLLTTDPAIDAVIEHLYRDLLEPYWPPERRHVESGYRDLPFPFPDLDAPRFTMEASWDLAALLGYLNSWSATKRFADATGGNAVALIRDGLASAWGNPGVRRRIVWPLALRVGRLGERS